MQKGSKVRVVKDDGRYLCPGYDFGVPLELLKDTDKVFVFKAKGHVGWSGIGFSSYYHPTLIVFKKVFLVHETFSHNYQTWDTEVLFYEDYERGTRKETYAKMEEVVREAQIQTA